MATNKKITDLTELSESELSDDDVLAIVDISAGTTNKVRKSTLASALSGVASITATSPIAVNQSTGSVVVSTGTIPITKGGTGQTSASAALAALGGISDPTTTRGDIITKGASVLGRLAIGADNTVLRSDGTDPEWGAVAATELTGTLPIANGGTNATSAGAARTSLGLVIGTDVAAAGANSDITSITGLTTDLTVAQGGTGAGTAADARTNLGLVIGTNVEAFNADIAVTDALQTFTLSQRGTITTDNDLSFDLNITNNFKSTPAGAAALTFTNITAGQTGNILLVNSGGHAISLHANTKGDANLATTISVAGTYWLSYYSDGTNVYVVTSAVFA